MKDFSMTNWLAAVSKWRQVSVLDFHTGYDLLNGANVGEDKRLAIDITCMKLSLQEDGAARLVRWVPDLRRFDQARRELQAHGGDGYRTRIAKGGLYRSSLSRPKV